MSAIPPVTDSLLLLAIRERDAAIETVERRIPAGARVSAYLYQPVPATGLLADSPGVLWDVGPLPPTQLPVPRDLLYQCAVAGRTGSFLQSASECTRRVPQTTCIDAAAFRSYRSRNGDEAVRRAQISVEQARHGFQSRVADGPPRGSFIHHLALAPSVQSFSPLARGRLPVLGTIFTVTDEEAPLDLHEYTNLVDYAIVIAGELLEVRIEHLMGPALITSSFEGSALEELLDAPTSDAAVQLILKLIFAHHWFFPYHAVAHGLLVRAVGDAPAAEALYRRHGWLPPRTAPQPSTSVATLRQLLAEDLATLVSHSCWYRLGREFRPRPGLVADHVRAALNTALLLLCGVPSDVPVYGARRASTRRSDRSLYLGPPSALAMGGIGDPLLAPVFPATGIHQLQRQRMAAGADGDRFALSFAACGPGNTEGHTRTHLKPSRFVDGFGPGGTPRFSAGTQDGLRDRTRWLCSYAVGRLAGRE